MLLLTDLALKLRFFSALCHARFASSAMVTPKLRFGETIRCKDQLAAIALHARRRI